MNDEWQGKWAIQNENLPQPLQGEEPKGMKRVGPYKIANLHHPFHRFIFFRLLSPSGLFATIQQRTAKPRASNATSIKHTHTPAKGHQETKPPASLHTCLENVLAHKSILTGWIKIGPPKRLEVICAFWVTPCNRKKKKKKNKWKKKKKKPIWLLASFRLLPRFRNITTSRPIAFYTRRWATSKYSEVPYEIIDRTFSNLCVSYLPHTRSSTLGKVHSSHADTAQGAKHAQNPPQVNRTQSMERGRYEKKRMNKNL